MYVQILLYRIFTIPEVRVGVSMKSLVHYRCLLVVSSKKYLEEWLNLKESCDILKKTIAQDLLTFSEMISV